MDSPCEAAGVGCRRGSTAEDHSGAKRPREAKCSLAIEFDVEEVKTALEVSGDHMVLGIDEAGRGPLIGPMVYSGAMITLHEHDRMVDLCHVADSKILDDEQRRTALERMHELKTLQLFTVSLSADTIAAAMTGRHGKNLNTLSHDTAIEIIHKATLAAQGKLCAVYVDTVGPPETYQAKLSARFPFIRVVVSKQADAKYPVVSAASIEAKVTRDREVESYGVDVGSGYPSDPKAIPWLRENLHRFFVVPRRFSYVRHSWGPVSQIAGNAQVCVPITFEADVANDDDGSHNNGRGASRPAKQRRLTFAKPPPRRPAVYTHMLRLKTVTHLESADE